MLYIGIDVHKSFSVATAVNQQGEILKQERFDTNKKAITSFIQSFSEKKIMAVVEASSTMYPIYDTLEALGVETIVASPCKVKAIASARIKTDKIDSKILAHLLRTNLIPECYIPEKPVRELRKLCRHRTALTKMQTQVKNQVHALLREQSIQHEFSDLFGKKGLKFLQQLELTEETRIALDTYLNVLETLQQQIKTVSEKIQEKTAANHDAKLLMSIPGMGYYMALSVAVEIDGIKRFASASQLCSWAGVVASTHQSGNTVYHGRITKNGNKRVRWLLTEATQKLVAYDTPLKARFERLKAKKGRNKAIIATARKLLTHIYFMLSRKQEYKYQDIQLTKRKLKALAC